MEARINNALNSFESKAITIDLAHLGTKNNELIMDVGQLHVVTAGDLTVMSGPNGVIPGDVVEAMGYGTKFFDAVYYFAMEASARPPTKPFVALAGTPDAVISKAKMRLLWTAMFLMLRGSYPESTSKVIGKDVPAFLVNICGMTESPAEVAAGVSSFSLQKINPVWIRSIEWSKFAMEIRQRFALGLAGYRQLGPFRLYKVRPDASDEAKAAARWVVNLLASPVDYSILSCTRSAALVARLGSWNAALGNLILECFTQADIQAMVATKIIYQMPVHDVRADTWRNWAAQGPIVLNDPIALN